MQQHWIGQGIKGWHGVKRYADRIHPISVTAQHQLRVLAFWAQHGLPAAMDAFSISRRTLFAWKKACRDAKGNTAALNNRSRAPLQRRKHQAWDTGVLEHLIALRRLYPTPGFEKRHIFLLEWCEPPTLACPGVSTLRRIAKGDKRKHRLPPSTRMTPQGQRRPKGCVARAPGQWVGVDTIEIYGSASTAALRSPMQFLAEEHQCNMYWRDTHTIAMAHKKAYNSCLQ